MPYQLIRKPSRDVVKPGDTVELTVTGRAYKFLEVNTDEDGVYVRVRNSRGDQFFFPADRVQGTALLEVDEVGVPY